MSDHIQGWAEAGAVERKEMAGSTGFLGLWPEHFTNMENPRSLHEPFHSILVPTPGFKKKQGQGI